MEKELEEMKLAVIVPDVDLDIWGEEDKQKVASAGVLANKHLKKIKAQERHLLEPIKEGMNRIKAEAAVLANPLSDFINECKKAIGKYTLEQNLKHEEENRRRIADAKANADKIRREECEKLKVIDEPTEQDYEEAKANIALAPTAELLGTPAKTSSEAGSISTKIRKNWRINLKGGGVWDKKKRLQPKDVVGLVHGGDISFMRIDATAINQAFDIGKELPKWIEIFDDVGMVMR